jgi:predicted DNA-binding transcriptional regulator AlpA
MRHDAVTDDDSKRRYVRARTLARMLDVHPSTLWRWVSERRLPAPCKLGKGVTAWRLADVEAALERHAQP